MQIKYWTGFSKRKNSTKQPTGGTTAQVYLKEDCSILNPVIECVGMPDNANYFYIGDWGRYYSVSNAQRVGTDRVIFSLEVDAYASGKSYIASTTALIEYAADSTEQTMPDPRNVATYIFEEETTPVLDLEVSSGVGFKSVGTFIVGLAGGDQGITYYSVNALTIKDMFAKIFDNSFVASWTNTFYGYKDCIVSVKWLPVAPTTGTLTNLIFGGVDLGNTIAGYPVTDRYIEIAETSADITYPTDGWGLGTTYLDYSPYTTGTIYLPFVGVVPLDVDIVSKTKQITVRVVCDVYTGDVLYKIGNESGDIIATYQGNCATDIPISSQSMNAAGFASGIISMFGGAATIGAGIVAQNPALIAGGVAGEFTNGLGMIQSMAHHTQTNGSISSGLSYKLGLKIMASVMTKIPAEDTMSAYDAPLGRPYFKVSTIGSHSGYIKCANASVSCPFFPEEKDAINAAVNGGLYYE